MELPRRPVEEVAATAPRICIWTATDDLRETSVGDDIYRPMFKRPRLAEEPGDGGMRCDVLRGGGREGAGPISPSQLSQRVLYEFFWSTKKEKRKKKPPIIHTVRNTAMPNEFTFLAIRFFFSFARVDGTRVFCLKTALSWSFTL